jgi:hypothetical protein
VCHENNIICGKGNMGCISVHFATHKEQISFEIIGDFFVFIAEILRNKSGV